jgi:hypothetical protein
VEQPDAELGLNGKDRPRDGREIKIVVARHRGKGASTRNLHEETQVFRSIVQ